MLELNTVCRAEKCRPPAHETELEPNPPCRIVRRGRLKSRKSSSVGKGSGAPKALTNASPAFRYLPAAKKIRAAIRSAAQREATEVISYAVPAFKHKRTLVRYGAFSNHCSLFPTASVIAEFNNELKGFDYVQRNHPLSDRQALPPALVRKLVKARLVQVQREKWVSA